MITIVCPCHLLNALTKSCLEKNINKLKPLIDEFIVVLNGPAYYSEFNNEFCKIERIKKANRSASRNHGVKKAKNNLIGFIDSDVEICEADIEMILLLFNLQNPDFIQGKISPYTKENSLINKAKLKESLEYNRKTKEGIRRPGLDSCLLFTKRELILKFPFKETYKRSEDTELLYRIQESKPCKVFITNAITCKKFIDISFVKYFKHKVQSIYFNEKIKYTYALSDQTLNTFRVYQKYLRSIFDAFVKERSFFSLFQFFDKIIELIFYIFSKCILSVSPPPKKNLKYEEFLSSNENFTFHVNLKNYQIRVAEINRT